MGNTQMSADKTEHQSNHKQPEGTFFSIVLFKQLNAHTSGPCHKEAYHHAAYGVYGVMII